MVLSSGSVGAVLQVAAQLLFRNLNISEAIEKPRLITKPSSNDIFVDGKLNTHE